MPVATEARRNSVSLVWYFSFISFPYLLWKQVYQKWTDCQALLEKSTGLVSLSHGPDQHPGDRWLSDQDWQPTILHQ
jgi:hypothetical protein